MNAAWQVQADASSPPERVWAVLLDGRRWSFWNPGVEWMWIEGNPQPGTVVTVKLRRVRQTALLLREIVPDRRLALQLTFGPAITYVIAWSLEPHVSGTRITCDMTLSGFAGGLLQARAERLAAAMPGFLERLAEHAATGDTVAGSV